MQKATAITPLFPPSSQEDESHAGFFENNLRDFATNDVYRLNIMNMKTLTSLTLLSLALISSHAQFAGAPLVDPNTGALLPDPGPVIHRGPEWIRFDIDFLGGKPSELVVALSNAMGQQVNALVSEADDKNYRIPAFKVSSVTLDQVFLGLRSISNTPVREEDGDRYMVLRYPYGFECVDHPAQSDSVWAFSANEPNLRKMNKCEFLSVSPYLDAYPIENITTVIETGWEMLGVDPVPDMRYHPETQLLIVVGSEQGLSVAYDALDSLNLPGKSRDMDAKSNTQIEPRITGRGGKTDPVTYPQGTTIQEIEDQLFGN